MPPSNTGRYKDDSDLRATRVGPYAGLQYWKLREPFGNGETSTSVAPSNRIQLTTGSQLRVECRCAKTCARFRSDLHRCNNLFHSSHMPTRPPASCAVVSYRQARRQLDRRCRTRFALPERVSTAAAPPGL